MSKQTIPYRREVMEKVRAAYNDIDKTGFDHFVWRCAMIAEEAMQPAQFVLIDGSFYNKSQIKSTMVSKVPTSNSKKEGK